MLRVTKTLLNPPFTNMVHKLLLPTKAQLNERMIVPYGDRVAVFAMVDSDNTQVGARYLMLFDTGQQVGVPFPGQLTYLTTVVLGRLVPGSPIVRPGQPAAPPRFEITELHVCELIPDDVKSLEGLTGGKPN